MSRVLRIGALCIAAVSAIGATSPEPVYTIVQLGHLGRGNTQPYAINDRRQVVGVSSGLDFFARAFIWENGAMRDLGLPPDGFAAEARGINIFGDVVGRSSTTTASRTGATLWRRTGEVVQLATLPGWSGSQGLAINDWGLIAGSMDDGLNTQAAVWLHGRPHLLGYLPGGSRFSVASDVNNLGQVVGGSMGQGVHSHATFWWGNRVVDLGTLPGDNYSHALAINDRGQVVGESFNIEAHTARYFLWERGVMRELSAASGEPIVGVTDINIFGVAAVLTGSAPTQPGLLSRGRLFALPLQPGQTYGYITGMNNRGDVVGSQGNANGETATIWLRSS